MSGVYLLLGLLFLVKAMELVPLVFPDGKKIPAIPWVLAMMGSGLSVVLYLNTR